MKKQGVRRDLLRTGYGIADSSCRDLVTIEILESFGDKELCFVRERSAHESISL